MKYTRWILLALLSVGLFVYLGSNWHPHDHAETLSTIPTEPGDKVENASELVKSNGTDETAAMVSKGSGSPLDLNRNTSGAVDGAIADDGSINEKQSLEQEYNLADVDELTAEYFASSRDDQLRIASELSRITTFAEDGESTEQRILDGLLYGPEEEQGKWSQLLADIGIRHESSHNLVLAAMPTISDEIVLPRLITSLLPVHVDGDHKVWVSENIKPYLTYDDEYVRASATLTQSLWVEDIERTEVIQSGFIDNSIEVRFSAATAATLSDNQSVDVKQTLLSTVSNIEEDPDVREQALNALNNYDLTESEKAFLQDLGMI